MILILIAAAVISYGVACMVGEPVADGIMEQKPKPKDEGLFVHGLGVRSDPYSRLGYLPTTS